MGQFQRCAACGVVMQTDATTCPICGALYQTSERPEAPLQSPPPMAVPAPAVPATVPPVQQAAPAPAANGSPPPPAPRPDPYTQIANPLNTGWGTTPVAAPEPPPAQLTVRRKRSPWLRRGVMLVVIAALAAVLWSQRERVENTVNDLTDSTEGSVALIPTDQSIVVGTPSEVTVGSVVTHANLPSRTT